MPITIGITQTETNYANYPRWIKGQDDIEIIELSYDTHNVQDVALCDGIVLSGGIDSHPKFYLEDYTLDYPHAPHEFAISRDVFELAVLAQAVQQKKPILGICRGLQLINVFFKGTLHVDIGAENNLKHKKVSDLDKEHAIFVEKDSLFFNIVQQERGNVNSAHHQAIDVLGEQLRAVAYSDDHFIEAIELIDDKKPFFLAVQWHPERMIPRENPFTKNIRQAFLAASSEKY